MQSGTTSRLDASQVCSFSSRPVSSTKYMQRSVEVPTSSKVPVLFCCLSSPFRVAFDSGAESNNQAACGNLPTKRRKSLARICLAL